MTTINKLYDLKNGTLTDSEQIDQEFQNILDVINGNLESDNIKAGSINRDRLSFYLSTYWKDPVATYADLVNIAPNGHEVALVKDEMNVYVYDTNKLKWVKFITLTAAKDVDIIDANNLITATNVEAALTELIQKINANTTQLNSQGVRLTQAEKDIDDLQIIKTNVVDTQSLEGRVLANESKNEAQQATLGEHAIRLNTAETDINNIELALVGKVDSVNGKEGEVVLIPSDIGAEPAITKNTAFNKNFGIYAGDVAEGNHTHNDLHSPNVIGSKWLYEGDIADGKVIAYDGISGTLKYVDMASGGTGGGSTYAPENASTLDKLVEESGDLKFVKVDSTPTTPAMPSNTYSNGFQSEYSIYASSEYPGYEAYKAFNQTDTDYWCPGGDSTGWIQINLPLEAKIYSFSIYSILDNGNAAQLRDWSLQGTNNGIDYTDLYTATNYQDWEIGENKFYIENPIYFTSYRLNITAAGPWFQVPELRLFEGRPIEVSMVGHSHSEYSTEKHNNFGLLESLKLNTAGNLTMEKSSTTPAIPALTSANSNGYIVSTSAEYGANPGYLAFDGSTSTNYVSGVLAPFWLNIELPTAKKFVGFRIYNNHAEGSGLLYRDFKIQGSNDGSNWVQLWSTVGQQWLVGYNNFTIMNPGVYKHYRLYVSNAESAWYPLNELNFFEGVNVEVRKQDSTTFVHTNITANVSVTANVEFDVVFNSTSKSDTLGEFNATTGVFTASQTGYYSVSCGLYLGGLPSNGRALMYLFKGQYLLRRMADQFLMAAMPFQLNASVVIPLTAGEQIKIRNYVSQATTLYLDNPSTYLTIKRVSD
jgi:hypothetical protein